MRELRTLSSSECIRLMADQRVGRIVFTESALPTIRPVNFTLDQQAIVVQTNHESSVSRLGGSVVAFEVDDIDVETETGWSVVVVGKAEVVTDIDHIVEPSLPQHQSWIPGDRGVFLRIPMQRVTGRYVSGDPREEEEHRRHERGHRVPVDVREHRENRESDR